MIPDSTDPLFEPIKIRFARIDSKIEKMKYEVDLFYKEVAIKLKSWIESETEKELK